MPQIGCGLRPSRHRLDEHASLFRTVAIDCCSFWRYLLHDGDDMDSTFEVETRQALHHAVHLHGWMTHGKSLGDGIRGRL